MRIIKIISKKKIDIASGEDILSTSAGTLTASSDMSKNWEDWIDWIDSELGWAPSILKEYLMFDTSSSDSLKILNQSLADALGFQYNVSYPTDIFGWISSEFWGTSVLILQGAKNSDTKLGESLLKDAPIENSSGNNTTIRLVGFKPINTFSRDNFKEGYKLTSHNVDKSKKNMIIDFFNEDSLGIEGSEMNVYGLGWRISQSIDIALVLEDLEIKDHHQRRNTVEFSFAIEEL